MYHVIKKTLRLKSREYIILYFSAFFKSLIIIMNRKKQSKKGWFLWKIKKELKK